MGKSKTGGTRGYIRGRIANDVYSIGKDGKGKKQQVIRSLAESVANPRTSSQMFGRMIMSTVMQAVSAMNHIIDHSFDGVPMGQPSISEFIRRNYALVSADAKAHPAEDNIFGVNKYQEKGVLPGKYVVSDGDVVLPGAVTLGSSGNCLEVATGKAAPTLQDFMDAAGIGDDDYFTVLGVSTAQFTYARFKVKAGADKTTALSSSNFATLFDVETNGTGVEVSLNGSESKVVALDLLNSSNNPMEAKTTVFSIKATDGYKHNAATLDWFSADALQSANTALPTYPTGEAAFLNGGDI